MQMQTRMYRGAAMDFSRTTTCEKCGEHVFLRDTVRCILTAERVDVVRDLPRASVNLCAKCAGRVTEFLKR